MAARNRGNQAVAALSFSIRRRRSQCMSFQITPASKPATRAAFGQLGLRPGEGVSGHFLQSAPCITKSPTKESLALVYAVAQNQDRIERRVVGVVCARR